MMTEHFLLPKLLDLPDDLRKKLEAHYKEGILKDPTVDISEILDREYDIDISARYGPIEIEHPIGKASGQLSLQPKQIETDAEAGLAFVVLKTLISEDPHGTASMEAWKVKNPTMSVERIQGRRVLHQGWTVSWAGRGWEGNLQSYLDFMGEALQIGAMASMPVIPSCKFHLPWEQRESFRLEEYAHTTVRLAECWRHALPDEPFILEQDFSPTLAGTDAAASKELVLYWLRESPALVKASALGMILGVKLMNALFEDEFQLEMLKTVCQKDGVADFVICYNRLFDSLRAFHGHMGIAVGGPDLSHRNLLVLTMAMESEKLERRLPISGTGNICSGRMMVEYALRGATSGQLHTYFQLPAEEYSLKGVHRTRAALHELYFHPNNGIVSALCYLREKEGKGEKRIAFLDLPKMGLELLARKREPTPAH